MLELLNLELKVADVVGKLQTAEQRMRQNVDRVTEQALVSRAIPRSREKDCWYCKQSGHLARQCLKKREDEHVEATRRHLAAVSIPL